MSTTEAGELIPDEALKRAVVGSVAGATPVEGDLKLAKEAAIAYVERFHGIRDKWPADYQLGAVRLAAALYRDKANPGATDPFGTGNVLRRATDVQIEQLLQVGRFAAPEVG